MSEQGTSRMMGSTGPRSVHTRWDPWLLPVAAIPLLGVALVSDDRPLLRSSCLLGATVLLAIAIGAVARERLRGAAIEMGLESLIATAAVAFLAWGLGFPGSFAGDVERESAIVGVLAMAVAVSALAATGWLASIDRDSRRPALALLTGALGSALMASYSVVRSLTDQSLPHWVPDAGLGVAVVCVGAAIVHPSRRLLRVPANDLQPGHVARRAALAVGAVLVGPMLLVVPLTADELSLPLVAVVSVSLTMITTAHIYRLLRRWGALEHEIHHDGLTGLPNRQYFNERLHTAIDHARRDGQQVAVSFLDLDHFKAVNDTFGHAAGNELLMQVARRLREQLPAELTVARLGGDEFAVLEPLSADPDGAVVGRDDALVQRILDAFAAPFDLGNRMISVAPSVGAARFPLDAQDASLLLERADAAMYLAKSRRKAARRAGLDAVAVEPSRDIELALRKAIQEDRLLLHYQPKVDLRDGRVVAVEALLRWRHASGGLMLPASFLPIAEDNAMMPALAEWVMLEACAENQRWREAGAPPVRVSVNVSTSQLRSRRMPELAERVLRFTKLPANLLELELNAESLELDAKVLAADVRSLRAMGVRCVIDDIGRAGRIEELAEIEIDAIELAPRHVRRIDTDGGRVVAATLAMAEALGIATAAEGIETAEQLAFVRDRGCTVGQGYVLARPAVGAEVAQLLHLGADAYDLGA